MERLNRGGLAKNFNCPLFLSSFFSGARSISPENRAGAKFIPPLEAEGFLWPFCKRHGDQENGRKQGDCDRLFAHGHCLSTSSFISPTLSASTAPSILLCSRTASPIWNARIEEASQKTSIASSSTPPPSSIPISGRAARSHSTNRSSSAVHASPQPLERMQSI